MNYSSWKIATIAVGGQLSSEVNLGIECSKLLVLIPTLSDSAKTGVHVSDRGVTYYPLYKFDADEEGDIIWYTDDATTTKAVIFEIGGAQYIKIYTHAAQDPAVSFLVRGFQG